MPVAGSQGRAGGGLSAVCLSACVPGCGELTAKRFSPAVRTLGTGSFDGWRALRSVTFVEGLEVLGAR